MTRQPVRVAIYARFSSDLQNATSIEDQISLCRSRAAREDWEIVGTYEDHATSGASMLRPGIQRLQRDASDGRFDLVLSEALDRLSRNQADIAHLYEMLAFTGVGIETVSEGKVNEMHIGLKGTMNALFLKDLATKTRRGLSGRIRKGKSAGGKAYGYDIVRSLREDGGLNRGDLAINAEQAAVIRRIFRAYLDGMSPNKIADLLNREAIPGPRGPAWDKSTIHGNPKRGTGILNNELYIGRRVWNRQEFVKDPRTGKRQARPNSETEFEYADVPDLRIIPQDLWDAVKARQQSRKIKHTKANAWERRKPRFLFSGLSDPDHESEARDEIRGLIERIVVTPVPTGGKRMTPQLAIHGALAGILSMALGVKEESGQQKTSCEQEVKQSIVFLVAGRRSRRGKLPGQATR